MDKQLQYPTVCALLHATRKSTLSTDLDIVPAIVNYNSQRKEPILVRISNITTRTVTVAPRSIICELQPVSIEDLPPTEKSDVPDILDIVKLPTDILEDDELDRGKDLNAHQMKFTVISVRSARYLSHLSRIYAVYFNDNRTLNLCTKSTNVMEDIDITEIDEKVDIRREQLRDPVIRYWIDNVMKKKSPRKEDIPAVPFHRLLHSNFNRLILKDGILFRNTVFGIENITTQKNTTKYVEQLKDRLRKSYELALRSAEKAQSRQKKGYDEKIRGAVLNTGDRVLVKILAFEGKHKLSDRWENDPYIILEQPNSEIPVFVVRKENGEGRKRTLHRNLLLPIGSVSMDEQEPEDIPQPKPRLRPRKEDKPVPKPRTTRREPLTKDPQPPASISSDTDSESEDDRNNQEEAAITEELELEEAISSVEPGQEDEQDEIPDIPRRSIRTKTSTATTEYKDFVCKQIQPNTDWLMRAQFLKDAVSSGVFRGSEDRVKDALLKIVTDTDDLLKVSVCNCKMNACDVQLMNKEPYHSDDLVVSGEAEN
ncbi:Hypothetical predicted protein [Mytilus galloprovincialis]|uniref:Uncharacterized protein n=1 Tax=Mytilus galloprovincialis TaxID=29158 RepID=A0A8B6GYT3_MYTGA|nr:Hypothetical predicted protein [Mytilus galloprovincialis]